ncbi:glycosyltransferase [Luteimonas sp. MC1750]|uniref:glycosyltransferase n=1 Tax=Luteimonas sp. MC1750 TaxID=2799326 RepID=UPI0018F0CBB8|nr:glycosyltransferase [Luteimonas sp. MC1750]MBJ6985299.1 glycosyltransferase [Luteimonas sp. MC1750]QQO05436.1 glycosyltransferase [Luteimonas sp. MC1750]
MNELPALVLVTSSFPITGDGSEAAGAFVADLAEELAQHMPIRVVAPGGVEAVESWSENVDVFRYRTPDQPLSTLRPWQPSDALKIARVMVGGARATEQAASAGPVAHILALWALPCGEWARRSARKHACGYSVWTLGSDIWSLGRIPVVRGLLRRILAGATHCWSDGLKLMEDTRAIAGREVAFLPSTRRIDRVRLEPMRSLPPYRFLFLGRWHPNKGVDLLLEALAQLSASDWGGIERVVVAGGGPLDVEVRAAVRKLQDDAKPVELTGYLTRDQAQDAMLASDYLLIPSRIESIPVVFSDAMKLGLPVVVTPVGDFPGLLAQTPACGVLAPKATADGIVHALREAIQASPIQHASGCVAMAARFDVKASATCILAKASSRTHVY